MWRCSGNDLFSRYGTDWGAKGFPVSYIGRNVPKPPPVLTLDALSHPIAAWAELESFHLTGDKPFALVLHWRGTTTRIEVSARGEKVERM